MKRASISFIASIAFVCFVSSGHAGTFTSVGVFSDVREYDQEDFPGQPSIARMMVYADATGDGVSVDSDPTGQGAALGWDSGNKLWVRTYSDPPIGSDWETTYTFHSGSTTYDLDISSCTINSLTIPNVNISDDGATINWDPVPRASYYRILWYPLKNGLPDESGGPLLETGRLESTSFTLNDPVPGTYAIRLNAHERCSGTTVNRSTLYKKHVVPGPCLQITKIEVNKVDGGIPVSGEPAIVKVTIENTGGTIDIDTPTRLINTGIYSIDVKNDDCDMPGNYWKDNEAIIDVQTFISDVMLAVPPGEKISKEFECTFANDCYTQKLEVIIEGTSDHPFCGNETVLRKTIPLQLLPNEDAYWNCAALLGTVIVLPITNGGTIVQLAKISWDFLRFAYDFIRGDFVQTGEYIAKSFWDGCIIALDTTDYGKIIAKLISGFKNGYNEIGRQGCGEAMPRMLQTVRDFAVGVAKFIKKQGYSLWSFIVGSPVDIEVVDPDGQVIYVGKSGTEYSTIPESAARGYAIDQGTENPIKQVLAQGAGPYTLNVYWTAAGPASISVLQPKANGSLVSISYESSSMQSGAQASADLSPDNTNYILKIDTDGDGEFDDTKQPDEIKYIIEPPEPIPTTSTWGTVVLVCAIVGIATYMLRKKPASSV